MVRAHALSRHEDSRGGRTDLLIKMGVGKGNNGSAAAPAPAAAAAAAVVQVMAGRKLIQVAGNMQSPRTS